MALYPLIHAWIVATVEAVSLAVDETWRNIGMRRRVVHLATEKGAQDCGLEAWAAQTHEKLDRLEPAIRKNAYPRTTNGIERFFRAFQRVYNTRGGVHSVVRAKREVMVFVVGSVFTIQPGTGRAPIEQIVPHARQMPLYQLLNAPFCSGVFNMGQAKCVSAEKMASLQASWQPGNP